jgi:hypothetical protein
MFCHKNMNFCMYLCYKKLLSIKERVLNAQHAAAGIASTGKFGPVIPFNVIPVAAAALPSGKVCAHAFPAPHNGQQHALNQQMCQRRQHHECFLSRSSQGT